MLNRPTVPRPVVSREAWLAARRALLAKEKAATRLRDEVNGGPEELIGTLMILDRAPKGRNETTIMDFVRRHDEYATAAPARR